jgi:hypothetical protein
MTKTTTDQINLDLVDQLLKDYTCSRRPKTQLIFTEIRSHDRN